MVQSFGIKVGYGGIPGSSIGTKDTGASEGGSCCSWNLEPILYAYVNIVSKCSLTNINCLLQSKGKWKITRWSRIVANVHVFVVRHQFICSSYSSFVCDVK